MLSSEKARKIQILLVVIGFGLGGLTQVESLVESGYLPWVLRGLPPVLLVGLAFFRRQSFVRTNQEAGNLALAQQMRARSEQGAELSPDQERFISRLLDPWWHNGYWLLAGGRELEPPDRA